MRHCVGRRIAALQDENGIALIVVLGVLLVFTITTVTAYRLATSTVQTAANSNASQDAVAYADGAMNAVMSTLYQRVSSSQDPTSPTLFGCATGAAGASDCTTSTPITYCLVSTTCTAGTPGTASVYGWFSGTNPGTFNGTSVAASTWLIVVTAYAAGANSATPVARTVKAAVKVNALNSGSVAAVWNHIFLTAPLVSGVCQTSFSGTNMLVTAPIYAVGNLCLTGTNAYIEELGEPVDLQVGGKLVMAGTHAAVGATQFFPITSGVVVGGCATVVTATATPCTNGSWRYWVRSTDTWNAQAAPTESTTDIESDYTSFDPGPKHPCAAGTVPGAPTGGTTGALFDSTISVGEGSVTAPDTSGSNTAGGTFDLTPSTSYACISQSGTGTGYLIWNNSSSSNITVSGITVGPKTLAINGNIFFDSNVTASQDLTYTGQAVVEFAGSFSTDSTICAVWRRNGLCDTSSNTWQGSSSNTSMLTLVSVSNNNPSAFNFIGTNSEYQGSIWAQPSSTAVLTGTNFLIEGPMSIGSLSLVGTNAALIPLPVIKGMPAGAPVPPNTGVTIAAPSYVG